MIRNKRTTVIFTFVIIVLVAGGLFFWFSSITLSAEPAASLLPLLIEDETDFAQATQPNAVTFPLDLGPHPDYQTEWWYYTGNLETIDGRLFGFQLTFFRRALAPSEATKVTLDPGRSDWRTNQVYLAHFTISDINGDAFYEVERFSRGAAGLAGAQAEPYRVWLENWFVEEMEPGMVRLVAQDGGNALDLTLVETREPILHGEGGLSRKGPETGNASYYYSIIGQQATGTLSTQGEQFQVTGLVWKDHEYSTSALGPDAAGWDWFSIQLDDGSALMFFIIRQKDGRVDPFSSGTFVDANGGSQHLSHEDWQLEVTDTWTSPKSNAQYPAGWQIQIPSLDLTLTGRPFMSDQELNVSTTYWEGATYFEGTLNGRPISGKGYVELTGYSGSLPEI